MKRIEGTAGLQQMPYHLLNPMSVELKPSSNNLNGNNKSKKKGFSDHLKDALRRQA